jgi:putative FmdB family regulatory protein
MPTYEYRCPAGHEFERFYRKISDATAEPACPTCGQAATRFLSGGAGLHFKGSGFYLTDYGKNAHRKAGAGSGGKTDTSGGDSSSSSESTSAKSESSSSASKEGGESKGSGTTDAAGAESKKRNTKPSSPPKSDS